MTVGLLSSAIVGNTVATSSMELIRRRWAASVLADPHLPTWPEAVQAAPNAILRSGLFAARGRSRRTFFQDKTISSYDGVSIVYTGVALDQSDLDVWLGALHIARHTELGHPVLYTERGFLRAIGRGGENGTCIGKTDRTWLNTVLERLCSSQLKISTPGRGGYEGSLIDGVEVNSEGRERALVLSPKLRGLYDRDSWSQLNASVRRGLSGHPLAQWIHAFYSTHAKPYGLKVATLHRLCGCDTGRAAGLSGPSAKMLYDWKCQSLLKALQAVQNECRKVGREFLFEFRSEDLVSVQQTPTLSQKKHLGKKRCGQVTAIAAKRGTDSVDEGDRFRNRGDRIRKNGG